MPDIHPIRLRGPWQFLVLEHCTRGDSKTPQPILAGRRGTQTMPSDWSETLGPDFRGRVRYVRNFGCPTALEPHEHVYLCVTGVDLQGDVALNGHALGSLRLGDPPLRKEITALLTDRNELTIEVELPLLSDAEESAQRGERAGKPGGLIGEVRLEIQGV